MNKYVYETLRSTSCGVMQREEKPFYYRRSLLLSTAVAALVCATDGMQTAGAQSVTATGNLNYTPPGGTQNWPVGDELIVGDTAAGTLLIDAGGTVDNNSGYVGYQAGGVGTVTVQGSDGSGNASSWTNDGQLVIGVESGSNGTLNILDGGRVTNTTDVSIGRDNGSTGNVIVSGSGSTWESPSGFGFRIGDGGTGTLDINDGGVVRSGQGLIGVQSGSDGRVTVSGGGVDLGSIG